MRLLFITSTRLGDAVLSTGVLGYALKNWGVDKVTVACGPVPASLFSSVPGLERVLVMEKQSFGGHWFKLWGQTASQSWDAVIDLRGSLISYVLMTRRRVVGRAGGIDRHRVVQLGELIGAPNPPTPRLWVSREQMKNAEVMLPNDRPILALGPTANWVAKQWPVERFMEVAEELTGPRGPLAGGRIVIFGAPNEGSILSPFRTVFGSRVADATRIGDLAQVGATLSRANLYIGNDSGLMHLAAATGVPTVGLFGPSRETVYGPWGRKARAVRAEDTYDNLITAYHANPGRGNRLMDGLSVDSVLAAASELLLKSRPQ